MLLPILWPFGFSDIEALGSLRGGVRYVTKYLRKLNYVLNEDNSFAAATHAIDHRLGEGDHRRDDEVWGRPLCGEVDGPVAGASLVERVVF